MSTIEGPQMNDVWMLLAQWQQQQHRQKHKIPSINLNLTVLKHVLTKWQFADDDATKKLYMGCLGVYHKASLTWPQAEAVNLMRANWEYRVFVCEFSSAQDFLQ